MEESDWYEGPKTVRDHKKFISDTIHAKLDRPNPDVEEIKNILYDSLQKEINYICLGAFDTSCTLHSDAISNTDYYTSELLKLSARDIDEEIKLSQNAIVLKEHGRFAAYYLNINSFNGNRENKFLGSGVHRIDEGSSVVYLNVNGIYDGRHNVPDYKYGLKDVLSLLKTKKVTLCPRHPLYYTQLS